MGLMDTKLAFEWLTKVYCRRGSIFDNRPSDLVWDSYGTYMKDEIVVSLRRDYNNKCVFISPKMTPYYSL
jgi:hypothetical protein